MKINTALNAIVSVLALIIIPFQVITTFLTGVLTLVTFGLFMVVLDIIWNVLFLWPLLGLSWVWLRLPWLRVIAVIIGFPHALLASFYCTLISSGGDWEARRLKMRLTLTWPFSFDFFQLNLGKELGDRQINDVNRALKNAAI